MIIYGLQKSSLIDYPSKIAAVIFTGGCNFRCPFCQNSDLVNVINLQLYNEDEIFEHLEKRKNVLDSVCISGGEPTLQPDLKNFISKIKAMGFLIKLDTNGTKPKILKELIKEKLIDYVAMDIKNSLDAYHKTSGAIVDLESIKESVELLKRNLIPYEFRTTLIFGHHTEDSIQKMGEWLAGCEKIYLQCFVDNGTCLQPNLKKIEKNQANIFKDILSKYAKQVYLRGY